MFWCILTFFVAAKTFYSFIDLLNDPKGNAFEAEDLDFFLV